MRIYFPCHPEPFTHSRLREMEMTSQEYPNSTVLPLVGLLYDAWSVMCHDTVSLWDVELLLWHGQARLCRMLCLVTWGAGCHPSYGVCAVTVCLYGLGSLHIDLNPCPVVVISTMVVWREWFSVLLSLSLPPSFHLSPSCCGYVFDEVLLYALSVCVRVCVCVCARCSSLLHPSLAPQALLTDLTL